MPCSSGGTGGKAAGARGGVGGPTGPQEGPLGGDSGGVTRMGADVAGFPGGAMLRITDADASNWLPRGLR